MNSFEIKTPFGPITATWKRVGKMIVVRYRERSKEAQASPSDASNLFVAKDIVRGWIAADLKDGA